MFVFLCICVLCERALGSNCVHVFVCLDVRAQRWCVCAFVCLCVCVRLMHLCVCARVFEFLRLCVRVFVWLSVCGL